MSYRVSKHGLFSSSRKNTIYKEKMCSYYLKALFLKMCLPHLTLKINFHLWHQLHKCSHMKSYWALCSSLLASTGGNGGPLLLSLKYSNYHKYRRYSQWSKCLFCLALRKHHVTQSQEHDLAWACFFFVRYTLLHMDAHTMHDKSSSTALFSFIETDFFHIASFILYYIIYLISWKLINTNVQ